MQAESTPQGAGDGRDAGDGFDPLGQEWLSRDEIELKLRTETAVYRLTFPSGRQISQSWDYVIFERWFLVWGQRDMIHVGLNGQVQFISTKIKWRDRRKPDDASHA